VYCVDPAPAPALVDLASRSPRVDLVLQRSLEALEHLEGCDAYLIDGDHNYYTVAGELRSIAARSGGRGTYPLVFLHDVGWPSGRRDMYYAPESIPPEARHDYAYDRGTVPWRSELVSGGFRGEGSFAWAVVEGGPRNGVLTAVEDFLADHHELALATVPCIFGLGIVYDRSASYADDLRTILARYDGDVLLRRLEDNRVRLYLRVLQAQDDLDHLHREFDRSSGELRQEIEKAALHIRDVEVENRALWARVAELEEESRTVSGRHAELADEVRGLLRARSFALTEHISRLHGRLRHRPSLSSARLRGLVDERPE
jgi:hypothetical protein